MSQNDVFFEILDEISVLKRKLLLERIPLKAMFMPLSDGVSEFEYLPLKKGYVHVKFKKGRLRIYAIKIDEACYLITGGAIKLTQKMQGHPATKECLNQLKRVRNFLVDQNITDEGSFLCIIEDE